MICKPILWSRIIKEIFYYFLQPLRFGIFMEFLRSLAILHLFLISICNIFFLMCQMAIYGLTSSPNTEVARSGGRDPEYPGRVPISCSYFETCRAEWHNWNANWIEIVCPKDIYFIYELLKYKITKFLLIIINEK